MKDIRFNISLYVSIPVIISGIALLSTLATYNITIFYLDIEQDPVWPLAFYGTVLLGFTFVCGLLIVRFLINPMERFAVETESLGVKKNSRADGKTSQRYDEMSRYTQIFDQVTELLTKVEAVELFPHIVGQSKGMRHVFNQIMKVAPTDSTVLVLGETGTGKELIAKSIHQHSQRCEKPFVPINCAAIPEGLLESELFGHEKGAFTGADSKKIGKFEAAEGGTIFLDEIGDMPLGTQAKLLRVIQESLFERVGGTRPIKVNVRFIAATNQDLASMSEKGTFRQDLFFRLNVFPINLPPLRDRREDIPLLVERFLEKLNKNQKVSSETIHFLTAYDWPGNVRELQNAIESASVLAEDVLLPRHLPYTITQNMYSGTTHLPEENQAYETLNIDMRIQDIERRMIINALKRSHGIQAQAARILGIKERSLWHRIKKYDIDAALYKSGAPVE
jgi:transcriptional regulator with GAF, ATPase, and Fis domain